MIRAIKSALKDHLSAEQLIRLSTLKNDVRLRIEAALNPYHAAESLSGWGRFELATAALTSAANIGRGITDPADRERHKRQIMEEVTLDRVSWELLEHNYLRKLFEHDEIYGCLLGAARYAAGQIDLAMEAFKVAVEAAPNNAYNYVYLARCASHGLRNDARALEILDEAVKRLPNQFPLVLSSAAAHYRQGDTQRANALLDGVHGELVRIVGGSDPTVSRLAVEIETALSQRLLVRPKGESNDKYNEEFSAGYWRQLWCAMNGLSHFQHGWAGLNYLFQEQIGLVLTELAPEVRRVINFGVFCANPDYIVAQRFPNREFYGVDREQSVKRLNELAYPLPNLHFLAANIQTILPEIAPPDEPSLLFHARTAVVCYPEFLRSFYRDCAQQGIEYIALWENSSLSRTTLRYDDFSSMSADSVPYYSVMFIHNYASLLDQAGYELIHVERRPSNFTLIEADSHLGDGHVFLLAKRRG